MKTLEQSAISIQSNDTSPGVFIVNFGQISHIFLVFPLLTLIYKNAGYVFSENFSKWFKQLLLNV